MAERAYKTKLDRLGYCEFIAKSDNQVNMKLVGLNSKGKRVVVEITELPTYMVAHIAEEAAGALHDVKRKVLKDIETVRQTIA